MRSGASCALGSLAHSLPVIRLNIAVATSLRGSLVVQCQRAAHRLLATIYRLGLLPLLGLSLGLRVLGDRLGWWICSLALTLVLLLSLSDGSLLRLTTLLLIRLSRVRL